MTKHQRFLESMEVRRKLLLRELYAANTSLHEMIDLDGTYIDQGCGDQTLTEAEEALHDIIKTLEEPPERELFG